MICIRNVVSCIAVFWGLVIPQTVLAGDKHSSASIVFVEAFPKSNEAAGYRMLHISADGKKRELAVSLSEPVDLIQCSSGIVTYMDFKGNLWNMPLSGAAPNLVAHTSFSSAEETRGKILLHQNEQRLYAVINASPGNPQSAHPRFEVKAFHFNGTETVMASAKGRASAMYALSPNTLEVVSDQGLYDVEILSGKTTHITPLNPEDLPYATLIRGIYSVFSKDEGKQIQVKEGLFGKSILQHTINSGFSLVQDINDQNNAVLAVVVAAPVGSDQLIEITPTGIQKEIYRGATIGSACYLHE